ncbi:hypothetical protein [Streptomyces sp. NPDC058755]|uniref:hypothetical protein n=1 Tax=Streptomyces sp. NPDC058755 TaxID=3346624 RepID=UPI003692F0EC
MVVAGDVWARGILVRRLPPTLRGRVFTLEGAGESRPGRALLEYRSKSSSKGPLPQQPPRVAASPVGRTGARPTGPHRTGTTLLRPPGRPRGACRRGAHPRPGRHPGRARPCPNSR